MDATNSIGRNTANNNLDAIFRFCVTFTAAKIRISERNAKQKTFFLISFPRSATKETLSERSGERTDGAASGDRLFHEKRGRVERKQCTREKQAVCYV